MKFLTVRKDGGPDSNVTGYWLIEWKRVFSIALLKFDEGSREAFHSHAFNCVSWVLRGKLLEERSRFSMDGWFDWRVFGPSLLPILTTRDNLHKVHGLAPATWVLTFRGPWAKDWYEQLPDGSRVWLTDGRKVIAEE
jgi:hypothetical protein